MSRCNPGSHYADLARAPPYPHRHERREARPPALRPRAPCPRLPEQQAEATQASRRLLRVLHHRPRGLPSSVSPRAAPRRHWEEPGGAADRRRRPCGAADEAAPSPGAAGEGRSTPDAAEPDAGAPTTRRERLQRGIRHVAKELLGVPDRGRSRSTRRHAASTSPSATRRC